VSRLFQHSPRQLRIARERLDKADAGLQPIKESADPGSIGRTRHEAEVKPPATGHHGVRHIQCKTVLEGPGAIDSSAPDKPATIRGSCTQSSIITVEGHFCPKNDPEQDKRTRVTSDNARHSRAGHLSGGNVVRDADDELVPKFMDAHERCGAAAASRVQHAPKSMIGNMQDFLGSGPSDFKPGRRQVDHRDEAMKETETGAPAVLDKYGRPWQQRQKYHYSPQHLNDTIHQSTTMDATSSNE